MKFCFFLSLPLLKHHSLRVCLEIRVYQIIRYMHANLHTHEYVCMNLHGGGGGYKILGSQELGEKVHKILCCAKSNPC